MMVYEDGAAVVIVEPVEIDVLLLTMRCAHHNYSTSDSSVNNSQVLLTKAEFVVQGLFTRSSSTAIHPSATEM